MDFIEVNDKYNFLIKDSNYKKEDKVFQINHFGCSGTYGDHTIIYCFENNNVIKRVVIDSGYKSDCSKLEKNDEAVITHWHDDHYGGFTPISRPSNNFKYYYSYNTKTAYLHKMDTTIPGEQSITDIKKAGEDVAKWDINSQKDEFIGYEKHIFYKKENRSIWTKPPKIDHFTKTFLECLIAKNGQENYFSLITIVDVNEFRYLDLADNEPDTYPNDIFTDKVKVVRLPHHGSKYNNRGGFMDQIKTTKPVCIISGMGWGVCEVIKQNLIDNEIEVILVCGKKNPRSKGLENSMKEWYKLKKFAFCEEAHLAVDKNGYYAIWGDPLISTIYGYKPYSPK